MTQEEIQEATPEATEEAAQGRAFLISPGPHLWKGLSVSQIMYLVVYALLLPAGAGVYFFGHRALSVMGVSIGAAIITEYLCKKLRGKPFVMDGSAVVTGLLLAMVLPPTLPLWIVALGAVVSVAIVKESFGGLGHNIFNPALGGRAFLVFDAEMPAQKIGEFDSELVVDFWQAFAANALCNLHVQCHYGRNSHHIAEGIFKATARALRMAVESDPRSEDVPSTKGVL